MHELGIAQSIVESVRQAAEGHGGGRVTRIGLRIGEMSGVNADALRFAFQMTAQDTELGQAELDVEEVSLTCHCPRCDVEFPVVNYDTVCPACQSSETRVTRGDELQVVYLEME
ncbi:MAG: hydrogenase maturation nickel metallochaperone HypA [Planctomycetes bacterium]|nr:hydrogenase maturation nickel metallochaperone HypA [Planctomycetota bacterium]